MKEFLEKPWWGGVSGLATIAALLLTLGLVTLKYFDVITISWLGVSITLNVILAITLIFVTLRTRKWKHKYQLSSSRIKEIGRELKEITERKRNWLPDPNYIWKLDIDNTLLTNLYGEAHKLASARFQDAKLASLDIFVEPHKLNERVGLSFTFYSRYADRTSTYIIGEVGDICERVPEDVEHDTDRVTFAQLPWLKHSNWLQFIRKACEKVGPLSPSSETGYQLYTRAWLKPSWGIFIKDGATGNKFEFNWKGRGEPIREK